MLVHPQDRDCRTTPPLCCHCHYHMSWSEAPTATCCVRSVPLAAGWGCSIMFGGRTTGLHIDVELLPTHTLCCYFQMRTNMSVNTLTNPCAVVSSLIPSSSALDIDISLSLSVSGSGLLRSKTEIRANLLCRNQFICLQRIQFWLLAPPPCAPLISRIILPSFTHLIWSFSSVPPPVLRLPLPQQPSPIFLSVSPSQAALFTV